MPKSFHWLVFLLIITIQIPAQEKNDFEKIYEKTFLETAQKDMPKALKVADSLYISSEDPLNKVKTLMLSASLYQQIGDFKKSICYAEKANLLSNKINDSGWESMIIGFLAAQYRSVGLYERSKKYTAKGLEIAKKIQDPAQYNKSLGLLSLEMGHYELDNGNFHKSIGFIEQSLDSFKKTEEWGVTFFMGNSYQLLGEAYFKLNDFKTSEINYQKAEKILKEPTYLLGLVYSGLGGIRIKEKRWQEADFYLKKAENIAERSSHLELKKSVYANINDYYEGIGDNEKATLYAQKYVKAFGKLTSKNDFETEGKSEITERPAKTNGQINIVKNITIIILLAALVGLFLFFKSKQKKQHIKFKDIIRNQQNFTPNEIHDKEADTPESDFSHISVEEVFGKNGETSRRRNESLMTSETETKLLELLDDFEKGSLYNNKNMSLPFLAGELSTNTKYLSYVINQHKSSDFKTYINRLRINYIVDKLINDDKYRQYKISILADECGFSSHSKFASVFKAVTDFSPSAYIKQLDSENQADKNIHFPENN
ncbi:helix-turn-helix domain-containing protein [Chryseobacterium sp. MMS23-Vi53]|uniref:helix-turn-helix domain-containing protein n=1 Tax=Chryseobacterium sp. MMS23-Vi53 TaxID=3386644 RepID=UPI0039EA3D92